MTERQRQEMAYGKIWTLIKDGTAVREPMDWSPSEPTQVLIAGDFFRPGVLGLDGDFIAWAWDVMAQFQDQCTFQVLTEHPGAMLTWLNHRGPSEPLPNVWLGAFCASQREADVRLPALLKCPAARRYVQIRGPVDDLQCYLYPENRCHCPGDECHCGLWDQFWPALDWVIVDLAGCGPMDQGWIYFLKDQCRQAGVTFQLDGYVYPSDDCPLCGGTGQADSGAPAPWGGWHSVRCQCTYGAVVDRAKKKRLARGVRNWHNLHILNSPGHDDIIIMPDGEWWLQRDPRGWSLYRVSDDWDWRQQRHPEIYDIDAMVDLLAAIWRVGEQKLSERTRSARIDENEG